MHKRYIVIKSKDVAPADEVQAIRGVTHQQVLARRLIHADLVEADDSQYQAICDCPHIQHVYEDELLSLPGPFRTLVSHDEHTNIGLAMHHVHAAWKQNFHGQDVRVGILDTGMDAQHAEITFRNRIKHEHNFTGDRNVDDRNGHGTHVAGTVAAGSEIGMAPHADLVVAKVLDNNGMGFTSWIIAGLEWCIAKGCQIVNLSLGGSACSANNLLVRLLDAVRQNHCIPVVAAGNTGCHIGDEADIVSPACSPDAFTVAALDHRYRVAYFSACGDAINIAAFGEDVLSTWIDGQLAVISGTSMAAPHVAGATAVLLSATRDGVLLNTVWNALIAGADSLDYPPKHVGAGSLNVQKSLARLTPTRGAT